MKTETVEYKDGDVTLRGYLAYDDKKSGKRPGVLVMPEAFGLGEHAKKRAERLAELGYVAFAGDPYGNGIELSNLQDAMKHAGPLFADPAILRKRGRAVLHVAQGLRAQPFEFRYAADFEPRGVEQPVAVVSRSVS